MVDNIGIYHNQESRVTEFGYIEYQTNVENTFYQHNLINVNTFGNFSLGKTSENYVTRNEFDDSNLFFPSSNEYGLSYFNMSYREYNNQFLNLLATQTSYDYENWTTFVFHTNSELSTDLYFTLEGCFLNMSNVNNTLLQTLTAVPYYAIYPNEKSYFETLQICYEHVENNRLYKQMNYSILDTNYHNFLFSVYEINEISINTTQYNVRDLEIWKNSISYESKFRIRYTDLSSEYYGLILGSNISDLTKIKLNIPLDDFKYLQSVGFSFDGYNSYSDIDILGKTYYTNFQLIDSNRPIDYPIDIVEVVDDLSDLIEAIIPIFTILIPPLLFSIQMKEKKWLIFYPLLMLISVYYLIMNEINLFTMFIILFGTIIILMKDYRNRGKF
jgi:hypothetical protein